MRFKMCYIFFATSFEFFENVYEVKTREGQNNY